MGILTADEIMNADDLPVKEVEVPAWGGSIKIKMLTKAQQHSIKTSAIKDGILDDLELEMGIFIASVVEPNLTRDHADMLANKNGDVFDEVLEEIFNLSAIDKEAVDRASEDFPDERSEVDGVLPSERTEDDGSPDETGDVDS